MMKWRSTGYQDPNEGEHILFLDPKDNQIKIGLFLGDKFYIQHLVVRGDEIQDVKWWMRLDDIEMPGKEHRCSVPLKFYKAWEAAGRPDPSSDELIAIMKWDSEEDN